MTWQRLGRILIEREALAAGRPLAGAGVLNGEETARLLNISGLAGGSRDELVAAFAPALAEASEQLQDDLAADGPLAVTAAAAGLSELEVGLLCLCAAAEADLETAMLAGVATGQRAERGVTVGLAERVFGPDGVTAVQRGARLQRAGLIAIEEDGPLPMARIELARSFMSALFGDVSLDAALPLDAMVVFAPDEAKGTEGAKETEEGHPVVLASSSDRVRAIQAAAAAAPGDGFVTCSAPSTDAGWRALVCQATILGAGVIVHIDQDGQDSTRGMPELARYWIDRADHLSWGITSRHPLPLDTLPRRGCVEVPAQHPDVTDDEWAAVFGTDPGDRRRPSADQMRAVAHLASAEPDAELTFRRLASGSLPGMARRVVPSVSWPDLILTPNHEQRLRELVDRYRHRRVVHDNWGLALYPSPGVVALFSGPSGTGKTTAAEVLAAELGVDMFRVDLSALVSKYIGETEKNLEQVFSAAHAGNYLLLFDEADSLFGNRSKVTDSKDRYANMEVSYLLQRLETYDGFVVLTSNFQGNIDTAFLRRMHSTVHFPVPEAADRKRIWMRSLAQAPSHELDLDFVAEKFDLAGGAIRNAALSAAFLAAAGTGIIDMPYLMRAISQELTKLGRRATPELFGPWMSAVG